MKRKIVFLIPTHNRWTSLSRALGSIRDLVGISEFQASVVVFDNGSTLPKQCDFTQIPDWQMFELRSDTNILMRAKPELERWSFTKFSLDNEDIVVHLDDDVVLSENWLSAVCEALDDSGFDACGSVERMNHDLVLSGQSILDIRALSVDGSLVKVWTWHWEKIASSKDNSAGSPIEVAFAGHRALAVKARTALSVLHDPNYLIGGEDLDYSLELTRAGARLAISPAALIYHRSLGELEIEGFRTKEHVLKSWKYFYSKWGFVRRNAAQEAGLKEQEWLLHFCDEASGKKLYAY